MNKPFKILIILSLVLTLLLSLGTAADASGPTDDNYTDSDGEYVYDEAENTDAVPSENENVFSAAFEKIKSYATEIFCAMTFIGSIILAYAYKKGLIPLIEKALLSIGSAVTKIKEKTESGELAAKDLGIQLTEKLNDAQNLILALTERMNTMGAALDEVKEKELEKEEDSKNLSIIVGAQVDMLYDIFMTSALPQYQKDNIGEKVARMKEALRKDVKE